MKLEVHWVDDHGAADFDSGDVVLADDLLVGIKKLADYVYKKMDDRCLDCGCHHTAHELILEKWKEMTGWNMEDDDESTKTDT